MDEFITLCILADKWQCECVLQNALGVLKEEMSYEEAIAILGRSAQPPGSLVRVAAAVAGKALVEDSVVEAVKLTAAVRLLSATEDAQDVSEGNTGNTKVL